MKLETRQRAATSPALLSDLITHTRQLVHIIDAITRSNATTNLQDVERLVQSCRCAKPVLQETIVILHKRWIVTNSESVKLKILALLERYPSIIFVQYKSNR